MESQPEFTPRREYSIEEIDKELARAAEKLKKMPRGTRLDVSQSWRLGWDHPELLDVFYDADTVLHLDATQKSRLTDLQKKFFNGKITEHEFEELKKSYFHPYFFKKLSDDDPPRNFK